MTDLIFSTLQQLPPEWRIVYQSGRYQLAVRDDSGPHDFHYYKRSNTILAYLSNRVDPLDTALFEQSRFVCKIGTAAGILWHTQSDEFCIFRDAFGMIPWLSTPGRGIFTTDPEFHAQIHAPSPLNPRWFATFLQDEFSTAKDDVYVGSERI
ncbi:MAG: hypothetical protein J6A01_09675, partial [Proteobacteria bacterium]|nr:hypothetical protein [Pseudomonadota bacterium]